VERDRLKAWYREDATKYIMKKLASERDNMLLSLTSIPKEQRDDIISSAKGINMALATIEEAVNE
jgi:hypothetical protein